MSIWRTLAAALLLASCGTTQAAFEEPRTAGVGTHKLTEYALLEAPAGESLDAVAAAMRRRMLSIQFEGMAQVLRQGDRIRVETEAYGALNELIGVFTLPGIVTMNLVDDGADPDDYEPGAVHDGRIALPDPVGKDEVMAVIIAEPVIVGPDIVKASICRDDFDRPCIGVQFGENGRTRFADASTNNVGRKIAIIVDGQIISAPMIVSPITGGSLRISGNFTDGEARRLAAALNAGPLPKLTVVERGVLKN